MRWWPFRRRAVAILPAALSLEQFRAQCLGREVLLLADNILGQVRFAPFASCRMTYMLPDGREFEVSVAAQAKALPMVEEPRRHDV